MNCPKAIGVTKTVTGFKPVLMNQKEKSFIVDPKVFIVWNLCNGKNSFEDIQVKFDSKLGLDKGDNSEIRVVEIISSLERIGLIQN